jgi:hypothetical protein
MLISRGNFHLIIQFYKAIDLGPTQILCSYKSLSKIHKVTSISYCYRATQVTFQMFSPGHEGECVRVLKVSHWIWSGLEVCFQFLEMRTTLSSYSAVPNSTTKPTNLSSCANSPIYFLLRLYSPFSAPICPHCTPTPSISFPFSPSFYRLV